MHRSEYKAYEGFAGVNPWPVIFLFALDGVISACMMAWLGTVEITPWMPKDPEALLARKTTTSVLLIILLAATATLAQKLHAPRLRTLLGTVWVAGASGYATINLWNLGVAAMAASTRFAS